MKKKELNESTKCSNKIIKLAPEQRHDSQIKTKPTSFNESRFLTSLMSYHIVDESGVIPKK